MTIRPDCDIQRHIEAELFCCPDCDETDIAVKVTDGVVMLSGFVRDFFHMYGAEEVVKRVAGVVAVANDIRVLTPDAYGRTDPQIARAAVAAIRDALPDCRDRVRPLVRQGAVTVQGEVARKDERDLIERLVRSIKGVACVVNAIALRASPSNCVTVGRPTHTHT